VDGKYYFQIKSDFSFFVFLYRPIIFCFDAEEFYFDGIFVFATIANREGEIDPSFTTTQSSTK